MTNNQSPFSRGPQTYLVVKELAGFLRLSPRRIRQLVHDGYLSCCYRLLGNRLQMIFFESDIQKFWDWYFITPGDLALTQKPRGSKERVAQVRRLVGTMRVSAGKAAAARAAKDLAKEYGAPADELDEDAESATPGRGSSWRRSNPPQPPSGFDSGLSEDWDDEMEPER